MDDKLKRGFYGLPMKLKSDPNEKRHVYTKSDLFYVDKNGLEWFVPRNYKTDGKSVPAVFWVVVGTPLAPDTLPAAVVHDYFCEYKTRPSKRVHEVWGEMLEDLPNVGWFRRKTMNWAVRWFGPRWKVK
jgi:hypothetical protein